MVTGASQSGVTFSRGHRGLQTLLYIQVKGHKGFKGWSAERFRGEEISLIGLWQTGVSFRKVLQDKKDKMPLELNLGDISGVGLGYVHM